MKSCPAHKVPVPPVMCRYRYHPLVFVLLICLLSCSCCTVLLAEETGSSAGELDLDEASAAVDRLDLGAALIDQDDGQQGGVYLQYTRSFGKHQIAFAMPFFDAELGGDLYLHAGDLVFDYAWSPWHEVSASPWVTEDFGTGISLSLPTGSVANGTGSGSVMLAPRLGTVFKLGNSWGISPSIEYQYAFAYEDNAEVTRGIDIKSQFVYLSSKAFWVNLTPSYLHDLMSGAGGLGGGVIFGKLLARHLALSLGYSREPVYSESRDKVSFDYANVWELGIHIPLNYKNRVSD
jgi:hypothetical protein